MDQHHLHHQPRCGNNMRLVYVDPTGTNTICAYRCDDGHHHEILRADKRAASVADLATVKSAIGPGSPRNALTSELQPSSVAQRDWPTIWLARVLRPSVGPAR
jgi:hypothetical protein